MDHQRGSTDLPVVAARGRRSPRDGRRRKVSWPRQRRTPFSLNSGGLRASPNVNADVRAARAVSVLPDPVARCSLIPGCSRSGNGSREQLSVARARASRVPIHKHARTGHTSHYTPESGDCVTHTAPRHATPRRRAHRGQLRGGFARRSAPRCARTGGAKPPPAARAGVRPLVGQLGAWSNGRRWRTRATQWACGSSFDASRGPLANGPVGDPGLAHPFPGSAVAMSVTARLRSPPLRRSPLRGARPASASRWRRQRA